MTFISLEFLCFLPIVLFLYHHLPTRFRRMLLLGASYYFYMRHTPWTGLLLFGTTFLSWFCAGQISRTERLCKSGNIRRTFPSYSWRRRAWLTLGVCAPLAFLFYFKYTGFFIRIIHSFVGLPDGNTPASSWDVLLPVGISFYTFQTLSYVIDVYRGDLPHESHFGHYALFVSFFPQLVAGPIERPGSLLTQLKQNHPFEADDLLHGFRQMLVGFYKKLIVADYLARFVDAVFAAPAAANGPGVALAVCLFAAQIYCDFSGYCDIAAGTARMFGIRLMKNFDHPYSSDSIRDFWHRWHISLTSWFTDYLYIPLGGSRKGLLRHLFNIMLVFFVSGLWHGAAWHYVVWGCIHGFYLICGILPHKAKTGGRPRSSAGRGSLDNTILPLLRRIRTFSLVCLAWIFFRAQTLSDALVMVSRLTTGWNINGITDSLRLMELAVIDGVQIALVLLALVLLDKFMQKTEAEKSSAPSVPSADTSAGNPAGPSENVIRQTAVLFCLILTIAVGWLMLLSQNAASTFLYFQF